jgi:hypothetical protein
VLADDERQWLAVSVKRRVNLIDAIDAEEHATTA